MAITKDRKQELVQEYVDSLRDSQAVVFVQSRGLTVAEVTDLRSKLREVGGKYSIVKNTLFRLALDQAEMPVPDAITGPIAAMYCPEDLAPAVKVIADLASLYRIPVCLHNVWGYGLHMASLQFSAATFNCPLMECTRNADQVSEATNVPPIVDGKIVVPALPGMGYEFDQDYLKANRAEGEPWWG